MKRKYSGCMLVLSLMLAGCGSEDRNWKGGLYNVWEPQGQQVGVMILHQGHDCFAGCSSSNHNLVPVAESFAAEGFRVYGFEMPPRPHDNGPIERFFQPVVDFINAIEPGMPVYMAGLSGGGWTTSVVTALAPRVKRGYSVSGDIPIDVRPLTDDADFEQRNPPHDYRVLYAMAGDRLLHIYNFNEGGYFGGLSGDLGYAYVNHHSATTHTFSRESVEFILAELRGLR